MIIGIDSSTSICRLYFATGGDIQKIDWDIGRELADTLIPYLREQLNTRGMTWEDISGIVVCKGPGSFTGLRISLTVMNTIADSKGIPIVGESGDTWLEKALKRLDAGENDQLVMPEYGREPNITKPRK